MPCTIFDATGPLLGLPSPARTAERRVKNAAPRQISKFVRTPADLRLYSRSRPIRPPRKDATISRGMAPLKTTICCSQLKSKGAEMLANVVHMGYTLADAITARLLSYAAGYRRRKRRRLSALEHQNASPI